MVNNLHFRILFVSGLIILWPTYRKVAPLYLTMTLSFGPTLVWMFSLSLIKQWPNRQSSLSHYTVKRFLIV